MCVCMCVCPCECLCVGVCMCVCVCMCICVYLAATLSLYHGRVTSEVTIVRVQGVVALGLGGYLVGQFLDCNGTNNIVTNLVWRKDNAETRFSEITRSDRLRIDVSNAQLSDEGIYMCMDTVTGDSVSINVTGCKEKKFRIGVCIVYERSFFIGYFIIKNNSLL